MPQLSRRYVGLAIALSAAAIGLGGSNVALGQGGAQLVFRVDIERLRGQRLGLLRDDVRRTTLEEPRLALVDAVEARDGAVTLRIRDEAQFSLARTRLHALAQAMNSAPIREIEFTEPEPGRFELRLNEPGLNERMRVAIDQSIEIIRRRIDPRGAAGVTITREGHDRVRLQVPGGQDLEAVKRLVGQTGLMTFRLVDPSMTAAQARADRPPPDSELLPSEDGGMVLVERVVVVSGEDLVDVQPGFSQHTNEPIVMFRFSADGTRRFAEVTAVNVGRALAIVLDDRVMSAPVIREPILGGMGQISGNFTLRAANDLAVLLRSGALPVGLVLTEER